MYVGTTDGDPQAAGSDLPAAASKPEAEAQTSSILGRHSSGSAREGVRSAPSTPGRGAGRTRSMLAIRSPWELTDEQIIRETPSMAEAVRQRQLAREQQRRVEMHRGGAHSVIGAGAAGAIRAGYSDGAASEVVGERDGEVDDVRHFLANNGIIIVRDLEGE